MERSTDIMFGVDLRKLAGGDEEFLRWLRMVFVGLKHLLEVKHLDLSEFPFRQYYDADKTKISPVVSAVLEYGREH